jgi:tetratricopeptide (TPR) repeat protein
MALANANLWLLVLVVWPAGFSLCAQAEPLVAETNFVAYARRNYQQAETRYKNAPNDAEAAWQFGRACFDLADLATNRTERAAIADRGISACRQAIAREPNLAPTHYYLGMNLAQLAQTKGLGALKLVGQMEREFSLARKLDEQFDRAGSDRNLGLLYRDAPAWGSIGSRTKARQHLQRAVELAPQYPENRLNLIEAYLKWGDRSGAHRELQTLEEVWPGARTNLVGAAWAASWADWEPRLRQVRKKVGESPKALAAPRNQP